MISLNSLKILKEIFGRKICIVIVVGVLGTAVGHALTVRFTKPNGSDSSSEGVIFDYGQSSHDTKAGTAFKFNCTIAKLLLEKPVVAFPFYASDT